MQNQAGVHGGGVDNARVLIVDDNAAVRGCLEALVAALGYHTEVAADGREALPKLESGDYAAVVCDLTMPHMSGGQLYQACHQTRRELARRFIFITGDVEQFESDTQPHLVKPFRLADIQQALTAVAS